MLEKTVKEIDICLLILTRLRAVVDTDRIVLASPCHDPDVMCIITLGRDPDDLPDILPLPLGPEDPHQRIIATNEMLCWSEGDQRPSNVFSRLMQAEMLTTFLGVPVQDREGTPVACLSVSSRLSRIWSRHEIDELRYAAEALRSMMGDGLANTWHQALRSEYAS